MRTFVAGLACIVAVGAGCAGGGGNDTPPPPQLAGTWALTALTNTSITCTGQLALSGANASAHGVLLMSPCGSAYSGTVTLVGHDDGTFTGTLLDEGGGTSALYAGAFSAGSMSFKQAAAADGSGYLGAYTGTR